MTPSRVAMAIVMAVFVFCRPAFAIESAEQIYVPTKGQGWKPTAGVVEWSGGLVGTLQNSPKGLFSDGLQRGCGVIFKLAGGRFEPLYDFSSHPYTKGCRVGGVLAVDGNEIYGVTGKGGHNGSGTVFRLNESGEHRVVHRFSGADGSTPAGGLVKGADGLLYGVTQFGGLHDHGTVYRIGKSGRLTTLHHFSDDDPLGEFPHEGMTIGPDGAAYGTARYGAKGGGTVFRVGIDGNVTLVKSLSPTDGCDPSRLALGQDGWLYGSAFSCGDRGLGTLYRVHPSGAFERLHSFSGHDGDGPNYALTQTPDGTWYGVTAMPPGIAFRTRFDGQGVTGLHRFDAAENGTGPSGPLLLASDGYLYGTTSYGGNEKGFLGTGPGTVFRLAP
jgi:uncharacterized repeat protein (TIGR03803 family)